MNHDHFPDTQDNESSLSLNMVRDLGRVMLAPLKMANEMLGQLSAGMGVETVSQDSLDSQKKLPK